MRRDVDTTAGARAAGDARLPSARPVRRLGYGPGRSGSGLAFALLVALASVPFAGWAAPLAWLLAMVGLIACEALWFARGSWRRAACSWLLSAGYSLAALALVGFYTGAAQTLGVTLLGVIMFKILAKDHADPRRLALNLIPPVAAVIAAQIAAISIRTAEAQPLQVVTLLACPLAVFWVFRAVQGDLARSQARLRDAATDAAAGALRIGDAHRIALMAEELSGIGNWRLDVASGSWTWSEAVHRLLGMSPSHTIPDTGRLLEMYAPEDRERMAAAFERLLSDGLAFRLEASLKRDDGQIRNISLNGAAERDASGRITTAFGTVMDVTELRSREQALRESEARYRLLADRATDIIIRYDPQGVIEFASPSVALFGYRPGDMVGRNMAEFTHPDDTARAQMTRTNVTHGRPVPVDAQHEIRARSADGTWVWMQGSPSPITDETGKIIGAVTVLRDVSARRAMEEELRRKGAEAEAAAVAKSEFLANMSHEIRTPLTGLLGFAGLLSERKDLPAAARTYVERIVTGGQALLAVVNDILDFSKLDADRIELDPQPFDPADLIGEAVGLVAAEAERKGLRLAAEVAAGMPAAVNADRGRIRQVLLNLLSNAIKFTAEGAITVRMAYRADDRLLAFEVADTGVGIPEDRLGRLFQRFTQVDGSITRQFGGTGLGLAIVKGLAELMGGGIEVESREGAGSTFRFTVPAPEAELVQPRATPPAADLEGASGRILIVDDVAVNRELVRAMLSPFGFQLSEASGGAEAVAAAMRMRFDLILMDLQMPGMDGLAATQAIRETCELNSRTPIVALSANVLPVHLAACREAGMDDHIAKPIMPAELITKVARWTAAGREDTIAQTKAG